MAMDVLDRPNPTEQDHDGVKRRQIIEGARAVFLEQGFDAASMGEIARRAGVSKGTLYVYFKNKEELFSAIVSQECDAQAEGIFTFDTSDTDIEGMLTRLGVAYVKFLCRREKSSAIRTVIAIADRMPDIGRKFYEAGPAVGIARMSSYLRQQVEAGIFDIEDCDVAAAQLLEAAHATLFKPMVFNFGAPPTQEQIEHVVKIAVRGFLRAYRVR
jgi:AcrR family transcriptional regulator